jgi:hypothetical protein
LNRARGSRWWAWGVPLGLFVLALVPRLLGRLPLNNTDELLWIHRTVNFWTALSQGDWAGTLQSLHPGVVPPWGFGAMLLARYDLPQLQAWNVADDQVVLEMARTMALFPVLLTSLTVSVGYCWLRRLAGRWVALLAGIMLALEPLYLTHSSFLHLDATLASLMFLAALSWLVYLLDGGERRFLVLSGVLTGLAIMTKIPAVYLLPFALLAAGATYLVRVGALWGSSSWREIGRLAAAYGVLLILCGVTIFLIWPVLWVDAPGVLASVVARTGSHVDHSQSIPIYLMGEIVPDPGMLYYAIVLVFRLRPVTLVGASLAVLLLPFFWRRLPATTRAAWALGIAYPLFYFIQMSLGGQKLGRYLLPMFPALVVLAAVALVACTSRLARARTRRVVLVVLSALVILLSLPWLRLAPYYSTYYNPLVGGATSANRLITVGGGEGLDVAAEYLNEKPDAQDLLAASFYFPVLDFYFKGSAQRPNVRSWAGLPVTADYVVITNAQRQRNLYPATLNFFGTRQPEETVRINGFEYAWIYAVPRRVLSAPPQIQYPSDADFEGRVRLLGHDAIRTEEGLLVALYWRTVTSNHRELRVILRVLDESGRVIVEQDDPPWAGNTTVLSWPDGLAVYDEHRLPLPGGLPPGDYRLKVSLEQRYENGAARPLPLVEDGSTELDLGPVGVDALPEPPQRIVEGNLGDVARLVGHDLLLPIGVTAGATLPLTLTWESQGATEIDYTVFVHLTAADGRPVAQLDSQPLQGAYPTSFWRVGERIQDPSLLEVPAGVPPGDYDLRVGMYFLETGERLPLVGMEGQVLGDSIALGRVTVTQP